MITQFLTETFYRVPFSNEFFSKYGLFTLIFVCLSRSRKFTLKGTKRYWFVCKELSLFAYKSHEIASADHAAVFCFGLEGCEVTPDVNVAIGKFAFKLQVISCKETVELNLRCDSVGDVSLISDFILF